MAVRPVERPLLVLISPAYGLRARARRPSNYGEAGALARYGPAYGLPTAYSGHMSLYDWGPPPDSHDGPVLLVEQADCHQLEQHFTNCRTVGRIDNGHGISNEEQHAKAVLCEGAHQRWSALWPSLRQY